MRVWDHARSATEIQNAMNPSTSSGPGLLGSFLLDEGSGTTANDATGNGNDATIFGAVWASEANACAAGASLCTLAALQQGVDGYSGSVDTCIEVGSGGHGGEDQASGTGRPTRRTTRAGSSCRAASAAWACVRASTRRRRTGRSC